MTRNTFVVAAFVAMAVAASGQVRAQGRGEGLQGQAGGGRRGGGGSGGGIQASAPALLTFAEVKQILAAAEADAAKDGATVGIAVVDANGDLAGFLRLQGASTRGVVRAQSKARTAILFGLPTKEVQDLVAAGKPVTATLTVQTVAPGSAGDVWPRQGGIPLIRAGKVVGGIGVGGGASDQDERIAKAGASAFQ